MCEDVLSSTTNVGEDLLPSPGRGNDIFPLMSDALCNDFTGIRVVHHNIQGLRSKLDDLSEWFTLGAEKKTIFCFSELWVKPYSPPVSVPGFQLFTSPCHLRPRTRSQSFLLGSCIFISCELMVQRPSVCTEIENSCRLFNVACCLVHCKYSSLVVASIYRSPSTSIADCVVELQTVFSGLLSLTEHVIIVGDLNIDLLPSVSGVVSYTNLLF